MSSKWKGLLETKIPLSLSTEASCLSVSVTGLNAAQSSKTQPSLISVWWEDPQILGLWWAAAWRTKLPAVSRFSSKKCAASRTMRLVTHQPPQKIDYIKSLFPQRTPPLQVVPPVLGKFRFNFAIVYINLEKKGLINISWLLFVFWCVREPERESVGNRGRLSCLLRLAVSPWGRIQQGSLTSWTALWVLPCPFGPPSGVDVLPPEIILFKIQSDSGLGSEFSLILFVKICPHFVPGLERCIHISLFIYWSNIFILVISYIGLIYSY